MNEIDTPETGDMLSDPTEICNVILMISDQNDVDTLFKVSKAIEIVSSIRMNWSKSDAFSVGKWEEGVPSLPRGLAWKE